MVVNSKTLLFWGILAVAGSGFAQNVCAAEAADKQSVKDEKGSGAQKAPAVDYIAIVNGKKIHMREYISALRNGMKKRFFHGKAPEEELKSFRKEVAEELVERTLLIDEAKRRGISPDTDRVERSIKEYDERYKDNPEWAKARDKVLPMIRAKLEGDSLKEKLEKAVHKVSEPTEAQIREYYQKHQDLFTTPEKVKVSMILLRVDPSSPSDVWKQASDEAAQIIERLNNGADFGELARIHSSDESAAQGGDMGFIHAGMLGENAQQVLNIMEAGELSAPVVLLEGIGIFRLDAREKPKLNAFELVKERAAALYKRDTSEAAWSDLLLSLKQKAKIEYNDAPWR